MPCGVRKLSPCNPTPDHDRAEVLLVGVTVAHRRLGPSLVGHDLHDGSDGVGLGGPGALVELACDHSTASAHDESHLIRIA